MKMVGMFAHVDWNWPTSWEKYIKLNRLFCKKAVALAYYESCRLLVMGSWPSLLAAVLSRTAAAK